MAQDALGVKDLATAETPRGDYKIGEDQKKLLCHFERREKSLQAFLPVQIQQRLLASLGMTEF